MYAGVGSLGTGPATLENENASDIPEGKKLLLMKKRSHLSANPNVNIIRNGDSSSTCENWRSGKVVEQDSPPKTVTIGNINIELRSVKSQDSLTEAAGCEDLQYGPGIVDRLRERFPSMGAKKARRPVVRCFSSLENLPESQGGFRPNGFKIGSGSGNVKKAQSVETLIWSTPEQPIFAGSRRPNARYVGGLKAHILAKNMLTDENEEAPKGGLSAPSINEDELPKPDTVKHVKKMFKSSSATKVSRFRKTPPPTSTCSDGAKKPEGPECAKPSAKESPDLPPKTVGLLSPREDSQPDKRGSSPALEDSLSAARSCDPPLTQEENVPEPQKLSSPSSENTEAGLEVPSPEVPSPPGMVVDSAPQRWQPAAPSTSIVFDFRGKDVQPHVALTPAPFGCWPAKVSKRTDSPPPPTSYSRTGTRWTLGPICPPSRA